MNFIDDLKRFMGCHYLSVADISDLFGISRSTGYRLLNGQKKVTRPELDRYLAAMAKRDPAFFSKPKSGLHGVSDDFFKGCLKQHRDTLADMQMTVKQIQAQNQANKSTFSNIGSELTALHDDITSLWSELQAVNACIDRQQTDIDRIRFDSLWSKIKSMFRGVKWK